MEVVQVRGEGAAEPEDGVREVGGGKVGWAGVVAEGVEEEVVQSVEEEQEEGLGTLA